jgi:hypothetical protein
MFKKIISFYLYLFKLPFKLIFKFSDFGKLSQSLDNSITEMDLEVENMLRNGKKVPASKWAILGGGPEGKNPKYQIGTELYDMYIKNNLNWEKERDEKWEKEKKERMEALIPKYGVVIAKRIVNEELWIGMDKQMVFEVKGEHSLKVDNVVNKVQQTILYFDKHVNRLGNDSYDFEITLEDGLVVGWKNRANIGTRIK